MLDPITCYVMSPLTKIAAPGLVIPLNYIILSAIVTFIIQCFLIYCSVPYTCTVHSVFFVNVIHIFGYLSFLKDNADSHQFKEINSCWKGLD